MKSRLLEGRAGRVEKSAMICRAILAHPAWWAARRVALFDGMAAEPALGALWLGKEARRFYFPHLVEGAPGLAEAEGPAQLGSAPFRGGPREPLGPACRIDELDTPDLILVPGLAFTRRGRGSGAGAAFTIGCWRACRRRRCAWGFALPDSFSRNSRSSRTMPGYTLC